MTSYLAIVFTLLIGALVVVLPRRLALCAFLFGAIFIPIGQSVLVGPLNFQSFRILILFGWMRLVARGEFRFPGFGTIDKLVLVWALASAFTYTLLWQSMAALQNGLGVAFNAIGAYFFFRCTIRDVQAARYVVKVLAVIAVWVAVSVLIERATGGRNLFYMLGALNEFSEIRDGALRCQGPFGHSILAGTFAATLVPLLIPLRRQPGGKKWTILGLVACMVIAFNSFSSGPVLTLFGALGALWAWRVRKHMRLIRWGTVIALVGLHLVMKAPVWALIARVSVFGSSSADHRYRLVDGFLQRVSEWWLIGTRSYADWGWVLSDVSNHYIRIAVDGGILPLALFIWIVVACFKGLGIRLRSVSDFKDQKFMWALGASLFAHLIAFMGVNYWDQMIVVWHLLLAMIACVVTTLKPVAVKVQTNMILEPASAR